MTTAESASDSAARTPATDAAQATDSRGRVIADDHAVLSRGEWFLRVAIAVGLVLVTAALYAPIVRYDFVDYDDFLYVVENEEIQRGITLENLLWIAQSPVAGNWHPITMLSHAVDCHVFGLEPAGHHAVNVAWHVANTLLVFIVFSWITGRVWPSALVAALFGWHPLHVESVAWIAERKDVLSTFFWLLTMAAYAYYVRRPSRMRYALVALLLTLGLMSKPMLVTLPAVLLLLDVWPLKRVGFDDLASILRLKRSRPVSHSADDDAAGDSFSAAPLPNPSVDDALTPPRASVGWLLLEKLPLLAISASFSLITIVVQRSAGAVQTFESNPIPRRLANAATSYIDYIAQMVWPFDLAVFYPHPMSSLDWVRGVLCAVGLVLATLGAVTVARRLPYVAVGWFWYLGTLVPVIGIVQAGGQARADRYTYVPLIGLFIVVAWSLADWARAGGALRRTVATTASAVALALLLPLTAKQITHWRNTETLFRHAIAVTDKNYIAHFGLGNGLVAQFLEEEEATGSSDPELLRQAIVHYQQAVALRPNYDRAFYGMAGALKRLERYDEAVENFQACVELGMVDENLQTHLGECYEELGQPEQARAAYERALEITPNAFAARHRLIDRLLLDGEVAEAIQVARRGLEHRPKDPRVADRLARILATSRQSSLRDAEEAVKWAEHANRLTGTNNPQLLDTLAAAYAEAGNFDQAIRASTRAIEHISRLRSNCEDEEQLAMLDELARNIGDHLNLYRRERPLREIPRDWVRPPMVTS